MCFAPQRRALFSTSQCRKVLRTRQFFTLLTSKCASRHKACTFSTSQLPKVVRSCCALYILTWKCASRHNGVHFFDIATSKSAPEAEVFYTFWLGNVLRATTACNFSTSQLLKVLRSWGVLYIVTWKCASRHNGVQFFISHLASLAPHPAALASLLFDPPEPQIIGKTVFRDFPTFSRTWIFFLLRLSLLLFSSLLWLFPSLLFICPYCRKFDF